MIAEALATLTTLGWAVLVWLVLTSLAAVCALYTVAAGVWWLGRCVRWAFTRSWRGVAACLAAAQHAQVASDPEVATDAHTPAWARKDAA